MGIVDLLTFENAVFKSYVFWSAVLVIKMLFMAVLTVVVKFKNKFFAHKKELTTKKSGKFVDPEVERVRRAHRNDMENILPFFIVGFLYVLTNPAVILAVNLFRAVAIARIVHTFVYAVFVMPHAFRGLSFFIALAATVYMALQVIICAL